jgi:hypothetical protein
MYRPLALIFGVLIVGGFFFGFVADGLWLSSALLSLAFIGGPFLVFFTWLWRRKSMIDRLRTTGVPTTAEVISVGENPNYPQRVAYRYQVADNERRGSYDFGPLWRRHPPAVPKVGDEIPILFDPVRPNISGWLKPT